TSACCIRQDSGPASGSDTPSICRRSGKKVSQDSYCAAAATSLLIESTPATISERIFRSEYPMYPLRAKRPIVREAVSKEVEVKLHPVSGELRFRHQVASEAGREQVVLRNVAGRRLQEVAGPQGYLPGLVLGPESQAETQVAMRSPLEVVVENGCIRVGGNVAPG